MQQLITKKQNELLVQLYKFRFLTTYQFQKLLNHKDPHRIKEWLKDLTGKNYIARIYSRKTITESTTPAVYYLTPKARHILKENPKCDISVLNKVYKEKMRTKRFINQSLMLADLFLYFLSIKKHHEELYFFTKQELGKFTYFPHELPVAYFAVKTKEKTKRYFLEVFDEYTHSPQIRYKVRMYLDYATSGEWEEHAKDQPIPTILFICPTTRLKKHIAFYAQAKFEKEFEEKISLFVTTIKNIQKNNTNVWEKVSMPNS